MCAESVPLPCFPTGVRLNRGQTRVSQIPQRICAESVSSLCLRTGACPNRGQTRVSQTAQRICAGSVPSYRAEGGDHEVRRGAGEEQGVDAVEHAAVACEQT